MFQKKQEELKFYNCDFNIISAHYVRFDVWPGDLLLSGPVCLEACMRQQVGEAITGVDLMCRKYHINHVVRVIDKLQQLAPGGCSATFNYV